jgi:outer membrane protein TolC
LRAKIGILAQQDTFYDDILRITTIRRDLGEISNLEKINGESRYKQIQYALLEAKAELKSNQAQLAFLIGMPENTDILPVGRINKNPFAVDDVFDSSVNDSSKLTVDMLASNPMIALNEKNISYTEKLLKVERRSRLPGVVVGWLDQGPDNHNTENYYRLKFGLTIPIWQWSYQARINAAKKDVDISRSQKDITLLTLNTEYAKALYKQQQLTKSLAYYEEIGLLQADEILRNSKESYRLGSITYYNYIQNSELAFQIRVNYLQTLRNYNQQIIYIKYLRGEI